MTEADIEPAVAIQAEAFGGNAAAWVQRLRSGARYTWRDGWVVERDGEIAAAAIAIPMIWHYHGAAYPISAIEGVAVRPTDRRRGLASMLMRAMLQADLALCRPISLLYPFRSGFYRRLGYATVGLTHFYRLPLAQLLDDPTLRSNVRPLHERDHQAVYDLHRQSLLSGAGGLERSAAQWAKRWGQAEERWVVYDDSAIDGYLVYQRIEDQLYIRELVALSGAAERGLWAFVAAQAEQVVAATYHAPIDRPLWALLFEPPMYQAATRGEDLYDAATLAVGLMGRLVDVAAAFAQRRVDPALRGGLTLALHDPVIAANTATLRIEIADGRVTVAPTEAAPEASCDIVTLTQLFCGVLRASDACWQGRMTADPATAMLLDRALNGPAPFLHPADYF
jgi:predicted acetyltransferase